MSRLSPARFAAAGLTALALTLPSSALASATCPSIDVVVARGSTEPANGWSPIGLDSVDGNGTETSGSGVFAIMKRELTNPTDGSTPIASEDVMRSNVVYPADLPIPGNTTEFFAGQSTLFAASQTTGLVWTINHLNTMAAACSNTRFVLLGYSQGALIMQNIATSPISKRLWVTPGASVPLLNPGVTDRITAVAVFADPGRRGDDTDIALRNGNPLPSTAPAYLAGTSDDFNRGRLDGPSVPPQVQFGYYVREAGVLDGFKGRDRSYCLNFDLVCSYQGGNIAEHILYGDMSKPDRRRKLAIFAIQKLRNQVDKTYANTHCRFTSATNPDVLPWDMSLTLRFQASVNDRATTTTPNQTTNVRTTVSLNGNEAALLQAALGSPAGIRRSMLVLDVEASDGYVAPKTNTFITYNDGIFPFVSGSGLSVAIPGGGGGGPKTMSWNMTLPTLNELKLANTFNVMFYGSPTGTAAMTCDFNGVASDYFGGRHFGRVIVS